MRSTFERNAAKEEIRDPAFPTKGAFLAEKITLGIRFVKFVM